MTWRNKAGLKAMIDVRRADNETGLITPAILRQMIVDLD